MIDMITDPKHFGGDTKTALVGKSFDTDSSFWAKQIDRISKSDVERALAMPAGVYCLDKLTALISPAAEDYLEKMAQLSHQLTVQRFGNTIKLYAPLYLSNYCTNSCRYCGFNRRTEFERTRLTVDQAVAEADIIAAEGFTDILLVSGEDREFVGIDYLCELARRLRSKFSSISVEIYQVTEAEYAKLFKAGIEGVTLYQETYDRSAYEYYHCDGPKADYDARLDAPDRIASAGMRELGLGVLLGLNNWRIETLALAEHAHRLMRRYWQCHVSISFPRLRPAYKTGGEQFRHLISDQDLVQMITALRLCFADVGLVLSTRECAGLRNRLVKLGITKMSAGSKTNPGGYSGRDETIRQFEIDDKRTPAEVAAMIKAQGAEPVWKDWDSAFTD